MPTCKVDHCGYIHEYLNAGITCWMSEETEDKAKIKSMFLPCNFRDNVSFRCGEFEIMAFPVIHDCTCHGFMVRHKDCGKVVFITDSAYSPFKFSGINTWMLESNYSQQILDDHVLNGRLDPFLRRRIMQSHMSLDTVKKLLQANDLTETRNVVLLHLSNGNADAKAFKSEIEGLTGINTTIASKGVTVNLSMNSF